MITIYVPNAERFELALDEVELEWGGDPATGGRAPTTSAIGVAGARFVDGDGRRAVFALSGITDIGHLWAVAGALEGANSAAQAHLVLYDPGLPQSEATRRLLTREVGLLLEPEEDLSRVLGDVTVGSIRPVPGVPGGYVVQAGDPVGALYVADALRQRPGVRSAYPLLKRLRFAR